MLKKFWNWLVISSENPEKVSLTVKGLLVGAIPVIMAISGFTHLQFSQANISDIFDQVITVIQAVLYLIASATFTYGVIRKLIYSLEEFVKDIYNK